MKTDTESSYFFQLMDNCIEDFVKFYNQDKYISKKEYDKFLDTYQDLFEQIIKNEDYKETGEYKKVISIANNIDFMIKRHNENFVKKKLIEYKEYFDNMFKDIDPNIVLDEEQRKAVLIDEDYSLVIAGAGSGKTTTMAAKVKYLIEKCGIEPKEIIILSFTNRAANELDERINMDFKLGVEVLTFHKLGMKFIRKLYDRPVQIIGSKTAYKIIADYVRYNIFPDKEKLKKMTEIFEEYVYFDEEVFKFQNFNDYFDHYVKRRLDNLGDQLGEFNNKRIKNRERKFKSINGEQLKSLGEVHIANYLYKNSVIYKYEELYPHKLSEYRSYSPDFTIFDFDKKYYLEYYGMTEYDKNGNYTLDDVNYYNNLILKKRELHLKYSTDLIEIYSKYNDNKSYLDALEDELNKRYILKERRSEEDIYYRLMYTSQDLHFYQFVLLITKFIERFKSLNYDVDEFENLKNKVKDEFLSEQISFIKQIYEYYEKTLRKENLIDFNDMINYAYRGMSSVQQQNRYLNYSHVIVDEYQDISLIRYQFIKRLSDIFLAKIVAVGDDWQSIFGFSGSEISLFTDFSDLMGYGEMTQIINTYRNSQELIDVAGQFVSKNTSLFKKELKSQKRLKQPVEIIYYNETEDNARAFVVEKIIGKIYQKNPKSKILILGRYNNDIDELLESKLFKLGENKRINSIKYGKAKITFLTIHAAKGLGYDQVILINALDKVYGFPSKVKDEPILSVLSNQEIVESIDYPEERRLFYVALTRTKNKVYIVAPKNRTSEFVHEIKRHSSVVEIAHTRNLEL